MKLKARRARSVTDSDIRYLSVWNPQVGLHYDVHKENSDANPRFLEAFWQFMISEQEADVRLGRTEAELQAVLNSRARFLAKRIVKAIRNYTAVTLSNRSTYLFCPADKRRVKIVKLHDSTVIFVTHKELFYYVKRISQGDIFGGAL